VRARNTGTGKDHPTRLYKRDFWRTENLKYARPHFRMRKVARVIRGLARGREWDLLDVGCGPATLGGLLPPNVRYHGIDIAISQPADNLVEQDILEKPIAFKGMRFDVVVAQGLFEYVGEHTAEKFGDIAGLLASDGRFVVTYQNFGHRDREICWPYGNVQQPAEFRSNLTRFFRIERSFPVAHNWNHSHPGRRFMQVSQARLIVNVR
jgi:SAM-dependent methyltransferase